MRNRLVLIATGLLLSFLWMMPLSAGKQVKSRATGAEEFFIISSVDMTKKQLFLKHPTEVTELMLIIDSTTCLDERGISFSCKNLRAGDTVFVVTSRPAGTTPTALRIRKGPMTIEEVHRKYMSPR